MFKRQNLVYDNKINGYREVRSEKGGSVLLGGESDMLLKTECLADYYEMDIQVANCSESDLTIRKAAEIIDTVVKERMPERLILHLGEADLENLANDSAEFDRAYLSLIEAIRKMAKKCAICLVTLRNEENNAVIEKMNRHILNIAEAQRCQSVDINGIHKGDAEVCKTVAFVYELGFMGSVNNSVSVQTLVKMIYSMDSAAAAETVEEAENVKNSTPDPVFRVMGALA